MALKATRRIREAENTLGRQTQIAAMTAHAMAGDRERCDDYLSKPLLGKHRSMVRTKQRLISL
jgi:CheY-like chemotaxis protein